VQKSPIDEARTVLSSKSGLTPDIFLAHVKCKKYDFYPKFIYLGLMVRRLMLVQGSPELSDDKDYIGNKVNSWLKVESRGSRANDGSPVRGPLQEIQYGAEEGD
jgi:hypothetical protein